MNKYITVNRVCSIAAAKHFYSQHLFFKTRDMITLAKNYSSSSVKKDSSLIDKIKTQFKLFKDGISIFRSETQQKINIQRNGGPMNREEFLLCHRNDQDISKMIPFIIISLLLPEIIPIIILKMSHMIPSPFFSSSQLMDKRIALNKSRKEIAFSWINEITEKQNWNLSGLHGDSNLDKALLTGIKSAANDIKDLDWDKLRKLAIFFGLSHWALASTIRRDLHRHLDYLRKDEEYLMHLDWAALSLHILEDACEARGISAIGKSRQYLEGRLLFFSSLIKEGLDNDQVILACILKDAIEREKIIGTELSDLNKE